MKTIASTLILAASLIGAAAHAADNVEPNDTPFQGVYGQQEHASKTRAQVQAELAAARAQGQLTFGEADQPAYTGVTPNRAQADIAPIHADRANAWYPDGA
ncbi:DUF4148 domain-containing protein [Bordetella genomosp. 13]|uniref:DUF4148 domain-containing protein n=1 Tax=Bordetella genomosp. 13 TaxID=463040 RepID=UPI0011A0E358|nr:DUF4148 domain-containing protein [Bordetella genomosp. 13]